LRRETGHLLFNGGSQSHGLSVGTALLAIEFAHVRDNGEGRWPPHGPYSSLHVAIYQSDQLPEPPWHDELLLHEAMLYGPHLTLPGLYEWLDDETLYYEGYGLYSWGWHPYDRVVLRIYESDPGPGREHDDLLAVVVERSVTQADSVTFQSPAMDIRVRTTNPAR
jgi:hypothetical protein